MVSGKGEMNYLERCYQKAPISSPVIKEVLADG